ncbi:MAG: hypothetical protein ABIQ18_10400 [Umezawaea sp.]
MAAGRGTSSDGLRSKKPAGLREKPTWSQGMIGQSSGRSRRGGTVDHGGSSAGRDRRGGATRATRETVYAVTSLAVGQF